MLIHLKCNSSTSELAATYKYSKNAMFRAVNKALDVCQPIFEREFIKFYSYAEQKERGWIANEFPNCLGIVDTTFQCTTKPYISFKDAKLMFSGKHWSYGLKTQGIHAMNGLCMKYDTSIPGARHDFDIFNETLPSFSEDFKKSEEIYYNIMADLGYIGQTVVQGMKLITPKKNIHNITHSDREQNKEIAKKRIVCENFYGRMKTKFKIMRDRYTLSKGSYFRIVGICVALTNFHILLYPLKEEDGEFRRKECIHTTNANREAFIRNQNKKKRKRRNRYKPYPEREIDSFTIMSDEDNNQSGDEYDDCE